jgi:hypothetical protein
MLAYASNTGTRINLAALRKAHWRILLTPLNPTPHPDLPFAIDNGAWSCHQNGKPFDSNGFLGLVERHGGAADFVILPDIVAGGMDSLKRSESWIRRLPAIRKFLLPLQDGMTEQAVGAFLLRYQNCGLFLGGTTEYKLKTMYGWGMVAHAFGRWYHVGRVNSRRRIRLCAEAGADSFDGTSATMYSCTISRLDAQRRQPSLLSPAQLMVA